jgi:hypothetical protein
MSVAARDWAWSCAPKIRAPGAKLLLLRFAEYVHKDDPREAWVITIGVRRLADAIGMRPATVVNAVQQLEELGYIEKAVGGSAHAQRMSYRLVSETITESVTVAEGNNAETVTPSVPDRAGNRHGTVTPSVTRPGSGSYRNHRSTSDAAAPADAGDDIPPCEKCGDSGWIVVGKEMCSCEEGDGRRVGEQVLAARAHQKAEASRQRALEEANGWLANAANGASP